MLGRKVTRWRKRTETGFSERRNTFRSNQFDDSIELFNRIQFRVSDFCMDCLRINCEPKRTLDQYLNAGKRHLRTKRRDLWITKRRDLCKTKRRDIYKIVPRNFGN